MSDWQFENMILVFWYITTYYTWYLVDKKGISFTRLFVALMNTIITTAYYFNHL